jgi:hypothetical protein
MGLPKWALAVAATGGVLVSSCNGGVGAKPQYDPGEIALVRIEPADGQSAVPRNTPVRMFFSGPVLPESVDDRSILVRSGGTFRTRPEGSFLVSGDVIEFDPTVTSSGGRNALGFPAGEQVLVEIPLKIPDDRAPTEEFLRNIEGNPIGIASGDNIITFTTGASWLDPVPGPPGVVGLEFVPGPNALGQVPPTAAVTVVFTEPVDPATFTLGTNIFLTNNTPTSGPAIYQQDIPSLVFYDGSLTRFTMQPVFGFGQGPFHILVNFIDPDAPGTFTPDTLPADLAGNRVRNFTFFGTFDTQFDPTARTLGLLKEDFVTTLKRDQAFTDALWGTDPEFPFSLMGQLITKRNQNANIAAITSPAVGGNTAIDNPPLASAQPGLILNPNPGEEDYCPTQNPLVGADSPINTGNPPASDGRRQMNLYRQAELGASGTVVRVAWGPDSDATFAATYPAVILRMGHKRGGTSLANTSMNAQFDVAGFVTLVNKKDYTVPQRFDVNGGGKNDGYLDWPQLDVFFDFDGRNDLLVDIEAKMGQTYQAFRTFLALSPNGISVCDCITFLGCTLTNNSIGLRQMDSIYGSDFANPTPLPGASPNPTPFVHVMQFEIAKLRSDARSKYYDAGFEAVDYLSPILNPLVQPGGASIQVTWSASFDGIVEDVPFTPNIHACDAHRYIRWSCVMRSNLFTGGRPRIESIEMPFLLE